MKKLSSMLTKLRSLGTVMPVLVFSCLLIAKTGLAQTVVISSPTQGQAYSTYSNPAGISLSGTCLHRDL